MRAVMLAGALVACSQGGAATFGAKPFSRTTSSVCGATFDAYSAPDPFTRGEGDVRIVVTSSSGNPVDGLDLSITPFMPAMGHGSSSDPVVTAQGDGKYLVQGLVLAMPGDWQLRTNVGGACTDSIVLTLSVE